MLKEINAKCCSRGGKLTCSCTETARAPKTTLTLYNWNGHELTRRFAKHPTKGPMKKSSESYFSPRPKGKCTQATQHGHSGRESGDQKAIPYGN